MPTSRIHVTRFGVGVMWRVQVWKDNDIVDAALCLNENLAKEREKELRQKYDEDAHSFKVEEDKGDPWWAGSLARGTVPGTMITYDVTELDVLDVPTKAKSQNKSGKTETVVWGFYRFIFQLFNFFLIAKRSVHRPLFLTSSYA